MKRIVALLVTVGLSASLLVTGVAGIAWAHVFEKQPRVTIDRSPAGTVSPGERVVIFGKVKSGQDVCKVGRKIRLMLKRPGPDKLLETDVTDGNGEYRFVRRPRKDQTVYTRLPRFFESSYGHSHECLRALSRDLSIDVT